MHDPNVPAVSSDFSSINIDINSNRKNNKQAARDDSDWWGKVPHLGLWQQATALSDLMDYIDTPAILMTLSIYPSPLSFLSLFPSPWPCSCILPQFKDPKQNVRSLARTQYVLHGGGLIAELQTTCSEEWFKIIWSCLLLTASVSSGGWLTKSVSCCLSNKYCPNKNTPAVTWNKWKQMHEASLKYLFKKIITFITVFS